MTDFRRFALLAVLLAATLAFAGRASAQGAEVAFGGLSQDSSLPVEVTADRLEVSQADRRAVLTGNVIIGQGDLRLSAARVVVEYAPGAEGARGRISRVEADGEVVMRAGREAAEAERAVYTISNSTIVLIGDVVLTQGPNAMSGTRLVIDLASGTGRMEGRVTTILRPEGGAR